MIATEKLYDVIDEDGEVYLSGVTYNEAATETDGYNDPEGKLYIVEQPPAVPQQDPPKSDVIGSYQGADGKDHPIVTFSSPRKEVKSALEHGMQRYAGAMQKLSEGDD